MKAWPALISGILFGLGLTVSGMSDPAKVLGFLNVTGEWVPDLIFVMGGGGRRHGPADTRRLKSRATLICRWILCANSAGIGHPTHRRCCAVRDWLGLIRLLPGPRGCEPAVWI